MQTKMVPCPQCGTANSANKRICYHCQAEMRVPGAARSSRSAPKKKTATADATKPPRVRATPAMFIFGVSLRQRAQYYRQMYSVLNAGIPVGNALVHVAANTPIALRPVLQRLAERTQAGKLLSDEMREYPVLYPEWEVNVVAAAEHSGALPKAMSEIAAALEMEYDLRARTNVATLSSKATALVFVFVAMLVFSVKPGTSTEVFGSVGQVAMRFLGIVFAIILLWNLWKIFTRTKPGGLLISSLTPRVPLIGPIMRLLGRIRFVNILGTLWTAGIPPIQALEIAARTTGDRRLQERIKALQGEFTRGASLASIVQETKYLDAQGQYLLNAGEATGDVGQALEKAGEYYTIELDALVKTLPTKIQLLMYAVLVPAVFWLMYMFYVAPMLKMFK